MKPAPHSGVLANCGLRSIPGDRSEVTLALACAEAEAWAGSEERSEVERRVGRQQARAGALELDLHLLELLEARVVPQHVGRGGGGLDAEGGAVQLHHLGALALAPEAVPHLRHGVRWRRCVAAWDSRGG